MTKRIDIKLNRKRSAREKTPEKDTSGNDNQVKPKETITAIRSNLLNSLRNLCQFYYLPFTTKFFSDPDEIIQDFLQILSQEDEKNQKAPLIAAGGVSAIVPTFHFLTNYADWRTGEIPSLKILTNLSSGFVNRIHSIEEAWSKDDPKLTAEIMNFLNQPGIRNGRLKIRITLTDGVKVKIRYAKEDKLLEYGVPAILHSKWLHFFGIHPELAKNDQFEIFDLDKRDQIQWFRGDFPRFDEAILTTSNNVINKSDIEIAKKLFPAVLKHSLYIDLQTDLVYIFSNNTEVDHDNRDVGLGGMFILINNKLMNEKHQDHTRLINYFSRLTDALSSRIITYYYAEEIINMSRRAATAQVMLRNSAHSIASHVISKMVLKSDVDARYNWKQGGYQPDRIFKQHYEAQEAIAWFHSYLRSRMDFLADMATTVPFMEVSKLLKVDVLSGLDKNRILLNYISGVSDFKYTICLSDQRKVKGKDIAVSIPNDILGYHGIYIILENIIRNTAKHGTRRKGQQIVEFVVEIRDCQTDDSLFEVWVYDNCKVSGTYELSLTDQELYAARTGSQAPVTMAAIDWLVFKQNIRIDDPILDPKTNALRNGAWGIIEMKVSAAYLRKISSDDGFIGKANQHSSLSSNFNKYILGKDEVHCPFSLCLDHHGSDINDIFHREDKYELDHYEAYASSLIPFVEAAENDVFRNASNQSVLHPDFDPSALCKIAAGVFSKIVIIDERIQHAFEGDFKGYQVEKVNKRLLNENAQVYVPDINLNKTDFEKNYFERLLSELKEISNKSKIKGIDYIVIHLGVIEKLLASQHKDKQRKEIEAFILQLTEETDARVIITSGRGRPENLPDAVPFIAFSAISQYTIETPFKTYLFQSLRSARSNI